ncbi:MAG: hypothetical protein V4546_00920 [Bacteroidota bacterium]
MMSRFEIRNDAIQTLNKKVSMIKRGLYLFAPVGFLIIVVVLIRDYRSDHPWQTPIIASLTIIPIYFFAFIVNPIKSAKLLNHVVQSISFDSNQISITTYSLLWKNPIVDELMLDKTTLLKGIRKGHDQLLGIEDLLRIKNVVSGKEFYLSTKMFESELELILKDKLKGIY